VDTPEFLTLDEVLFLHDESIRRFGGSYGLGDQGLVESALGAAQNTFHYGGGDLFAIAATYAFHLAESQAFTDGNKRTAVASALAFLRKNGIRIRRDDSTICEAMIAIANKQLDKPGLADVLRRFAK
jgi:death-on-curing protein